MDYRLTDSVADPPGEPIRHVEELVRLPGGFCCYLPPSESPDVGPLPGLRSERITFRSMHKLVKLNSQVLDLWSRLLKMLPESRLLLFRDTLQGSTAEFFRRELVQRGIAEGQLEIRHRRRSQEGTWRFMQISTLHSMSFLGADMPPPANHCGWAYRSSRSADAARRPDGRQRFEPGWVERLDCRNAG